MELLSKIHRAEHNKRQPDDLPPESARAGLIETTIPPPRRWAVGRRLAFSIEDGWIKMAAARHLPGKSDLLDVSLVSLVGDSEAAVRREEHLSLTVADYVARFGGRTPEIELVVSSRETAFRCFLMPQLKKRELASAISYEARKQVPFPPDDCIVDYQRTFRIVDQDRSRYKIALHATTTKLIKEQIEPFRQKGLQVTGIAIADDALGHLLAASTGFDADTVYTVLTIEENSCKIAYYRGAALEFVHRGAVGSVHLGDEPDIAQINYFAERLTGELSTSQDFYSGQYGRVLPNRILVVGNITKEKELLEHISEKSSFEFVPFPLPENLNDKSEVIYSCLPVVSAAITRYQLCNLLPKQLRIDRINHRIDRFGRLGLALLGTVLMVNWAAMRLSLRTDLTAAETLEHQVKVTEQSDAYRSHLAIMQQITFDRAYMNMAEKPAGYLNYSLKELSLLTPEKVQLYRYEYAPNLLENNRNLILYGKVSSSDVPPEIILAQYIEKLKASPFYHDVLLKRHSKRKYRDEFIIDFQIELQGVA